MQITTHTPEYNAGLLEAADIKQNLDNVHLVYPEFNATDKKVYLEQTGSSPTGFNDLYLINGIEKVMVKLRETLHNCSLNEETFLESESEV